MDHHPDRFYISGEVTACTAAVVNKDRHILRMRRSDLKQTGEKKCRRKK